MKADKKTTLRLGCALLLALDAAIPVRADYQSTVLSQAPVGYWRLNETNQPQNITFTTNTGSLRASANGTYNNSPPRALPGPFTGSLAVGFDGISQTVTSPYQAGLNPAKFTIEAWVNPASATVPGGLLCVAASMHTGATGSTNRSGWLIYQSDGTASGASGVGWYLRMYATNGLNFSIALLAPQTVVAGTWTHLAFTYDGTTAKAYINGAPVNSGVPSGFVPNNDSNFEIGARSDGGFPWPGQAAQVAYYATAVSASRIAAHYTAATTTPASYAATVQTDAPVLYYQFQEPADVVASNIGTLGSLANGKYEVGTRPGVTGPTPAAFPGFSATNTAVAFTNSGASVAVPELNLNTNTVTISGWVSATNLQSAGAGLIVCDSGSTYAGLTINVLDGGLELGYVWNNDPNTFNWDAAAYGGPLPTLPNSAWAYVALVIRPTQAEIYLSSPTIPFTSATNVYTHVNQAFSGATLFGSDGATNTLALNGALDEVAIWNRSLGAGELYTQYASAVGGLGPTIFGDPQPPAQPVVFGDTLSLAVDAGGTPNLTYYWRRNTSTIVLVATNSNVFSKANFGAGDVGVYDVIVSNAFGYVTSGTALVTGQSQTAPVITSGPVGRTLYPGGTLNLNVVATGGGLKYQWFTNGVPLPGATAASYIVPSVTVTNAGSYTVSVTNSLGATNLGPAVITIPVLATNTYAAVVDADAPEAWWRLDETVATSGSPMVDSMGRHDGTYTNLGGLTVGSPGAISGGISGTAASFNGDGSFGIVPYAEVFNGGNFSLECWAKLSTVVNGVAVVSSWDNNNGYGVGTQSGNWYGLVGVSGTAYIFGQGPGVTAGYDPAIQPNQWVHLVIIHDTTVVQDGVHYPYSFYINGTTDGYGYAEGSFTGSQPLIIGGLGTGTASILDDFMIGSVDEVAFYNKALTPAQIQAHYAAATFGVPPSFSAQPKSQDAFAGENATFSVATVGNQPITLQWKKNGVALAGQTNNTLTVSNVYYTNTGTIYSVAATNSVGGVLSSNAVLTVYYPPTFADLTNGLVLHLKFDGDYADSSGHNNNATPVGSPSLVAGKIGTGAFSNSTDTTAGIYNYATLGTPADLLFTSNVNFSVAYWVKLEPGETNGDLPFLSSSETSWGGFGVTFAPSYKLGGWSWALGDDNGNYAGLYGPDNSINDGSWHHLVHTFNRNGNGTTYLDGVQVNATSLAGLADIDSGLTFNIGQGADGLYQESGTATLDDMGIWRRELTDIEARSIYRVGQNYGKTFDTFGPVVITLNRLANGNIELIWQTGTLKSATSLNGPWIAVSGASAPYYQFTPTRTNTFFGVGP